MSSTDPYPTRAGPRPDWTRRLARHWRHRQLTKVAGICAFMALFFVGYFHLLRHPRHPPSVMPLTALDLAIAYRPEALWAYVSLWAYVGVPPALMISLPGALRYGAWAAGLCSAGLLSFWLWPTALPPQWAPAAPAGDAALALLRGLDAPGNACPSLHVASAVFTALWLDRQLLAFGTPWLPRLVNMAWVAAIVWSTLALRQHVAVDAIAGAALGLLFGTAALRWGPPPLGEAGGSGA